LSVCLFRPPLFDLKVLETNL